MHIRARSSETQCSFLISPNTRSSDLGQVTPGTQPSIVTHSPSCQHFVRSYKPVSRETARIHEHVPSPCRRPAVQLVSLFHEATTSDFVSQPKRLRSPIAASSRPFKCLTLWPLRREWRSQRCWDRIPARARFFLPVQTQRSRPGLLHKGYRAFPRDKAAGAWCWSPTAFLRQDVNGFKLHLGLPSVPAKELHGVTFTATITYKLHE
jgi:hypothetical protein